LRSDRIATIFTITPGLPMSNKGKLGAIGLDIGGTKIAAGVLLWPSGEVLQRTRISTRPARGGAAVLDDTLALAKGLAEWSCGEGIEVAGIGAGVAELVDRDGSVTTSCTIPWRGMPVREHLCQIAPATVESDVRAAALGESIFGAGRGCPLFVYVTVGTGISSCLVLGGQPLKGARGNAITLSSSPLTTVCTHCGTKIHPVLEEFASGPAIARRYAQRTARPMADSTLECEDVFRAASAGDQSAAQILTSAGEALGVSVAFLVNVLDPEMVVVGGGLGIAGGIYWDAFRKSCREHIFAEDARTLPIVPAQLGADAGIVGAAAAVFSSQYEKAQ
jgi:glucokinase